MKLFEIDQDTPYRGKFAWAAGYGPISEMPFLFDTEVDSMFEYWRVNPMPPGIEINPGASKWPDVLGCGGSPPLYFVSEKVVNSLRRERIEFARATEMPIATINSKALRKVPPLRYFVLEANPGIETDYKASGIPVDAAGKPIWNPMPKPWPPIWKFKRKSWSGADLFAGPNIWNRPSTSLLCTERVVQLADREGWTNVRFDPVKVV